MGAPPVLGSCPGLGTQNSGDTPPFWREFTLLVYFVFNTRVKINIFTVSNVPLMVVWKKIPEGKCMISKIMQCILTTTSRSNGGDFAASG